MAPPNNGNPKVSSLIAGVARSLHLGPGKKSGKGKGKGSRRPVRPRRGPKPTRPGKKYVSAPGLNPNAEGPRSVAKIERMAGKQRDSDRSEGLASLASNYLSTSSIETCEDIQVTINPYILCQYVGGLVMKTCAASDRPQDYAVAIQMIVYYCSNMQEIGSQPVTTWPRALVELAWALTNRRIGKYNYSCHWDAVSAWALNVGTAGFGVGNSGWLPVFPQNGGTTTASGYITQAAAGALAVVTQSQIENFQANYMTILDLVNIEDYKCLDKSNDASAFAFDAGGGKPMLSSGSFTLTIASMIGFNDLAPMYITADSESVLETAIHRPHLAAIRLGTPVAAYGSPAYHSMAVNIQRLGRRAIVVSATPGLLGYQRATPGLRGKCQLKLVPGTSVLTAIMRRLEAAAVKIGAATSPTWQASFSAADIQNLTIYLYKAFLKQFSGAMVGAISVTPAGTTLQPVSAEQCFASSSIRSMRVPEFLQKLVGAQSIFTDNDGSLIPFVTQFAVIPTPSLTYTGPGVYASSPTVAQAGWAVNISSIVTAYKPFEAYLAQFENMQFSGQYGPSLLDATFTRDSNAAFLCGMCSRRRLTSEFEAEVMTVIPAITYDVVAATSGTLNLLETTFNHAYRQHNRKVYSGYDSISSLIAASNYDGVVVGALTSNISNATGPDNGPARPLEFQLPPGAPLRPAMVLRKDFKGKEVSLVTKFAQRLIPRAGNYCGPGWTAGVDTAVEGAPQGEDGKYLVPPTNEEDAICKKHDEAYNQAAGDAKKVSAADWKMISALNELRAKKGLSFYGAAAELAIAVKVGIPTLSEEGTKEYFGAY